MELAKQYQEENKLEPKMINQINLVRICEYMLLSIGLLESRGDKLTEVFEKIDAKSRQESTFKFPMGLKPRGDKLNK